MRGDIRVSGYQEVEAMYNMDQTKLVEVINQMIINKYTRNILIIRSRMIKLYSCFPFTGAPNVSDPQSIAIIEDLRKFAASNCRISNN
jgi:hypothetical protein